ncbi:histidine kinase dimerization/phosphoacceptor domain -containing protein [Maribacter sp. R77961]|uniref:tetratricopeptide repeat-containing sensor histidine kinase n=1 Tax=Maribacter sp. R77961 TaxID=3093871 RepID=UPI0037CBD3F2
MSISKLISFTLFLLLTFHDGLAQSKINTQKLDSIHVLLKKSTNTTKKIDALLALCNYYRKINTENLDSLSHYATKIINLAGSQKELENRKVDALDHLAFVTYYRRENDLAKKYIKEYKEISQKTGYGTGLSNASYLSAYLALDDGDINKYIYQLENAYQIAKDYNVPEPVIFKMGIGLSSGYSVYNFNSDLIANVLLEMQDLVESPDISLQDKGIFYLDLGTLYDATNEQEKAKLNFEKSIQFFKSDNNFIDLHAPLINLASYYNGVGNPKKAITIFKEALALDVPYARADIYYGLGLSFFGLKDYKESESNFKKAKDYYNEANDYRAVGDCLNFLGKIYFEKKATQQANFFFDLAIKKYLKSIASNKKNNIKKTEITSAYFKIASIYKIQNNFKKSLAYHKLYASYKDSVALNQNLKKSERYDFFKTTTQKNNAIKNLETESKLQEIRNSKEQSYRIGVLVLTVLILLLLVIGISRNRLKQRAIKAIREKNEENKLLMRDIHHRVKNNLQIISSLLGAKIDSNAADENIKNILQESQNKIRSMAIIHQNLYQGNQYTKVSVNSYVEELIAQIKNSFTQHSNAIFFDVDIAPKEIPMGLAVPLGLILNELIINAYKYAFIDKHGKEKKIGIRFHQLENTSRYSLIVKDNGKGLPANLDLNNLSSFGLQLVFGLTEQLHGEVKITQDKGTTFTIILEEPQEA